MIFILRWLLMMRKERNQAAAAKELVTSFLGLGNREERQEGKLLQLIPAFATFIRQ